jgi:dTDP-4-amino-4,6-dideoxygalactose transaminase
MLGVTRLNAWPPLPPSVYVRRPGPLPFPLQEPGCRLFALGRHALWHGVRALGLEPRDEILVPAYHHGSEVEALARAGLVCRFYAGNDELRPTESELATLVGPRTRGLLLIHYLGFPQELARWRRWCDERELFLIEDAAQAWLARDDGRPVGSVGDLAIFCLYKTYGFPDGAALVSRRPPARPTSAANLGVTATARRHVSWVLSRAPLTRRDLLRRAGSTLTNEFDLDEPGTSPSRATTFLIKRVVTTDAAATRRRNYETLLERLQGRVARPFDSLPDGAVPFLFPLDTSDKEALLETISTHGIRALDFWSFGHPSLDADRFPAVEERRRRTIGLPVHQELRPRDVERIAAVVAKADKTGDR